MRLTCEGLCMRKVPVLPSAALLVLTVWLAALRSAQAGAEQADLVDLARQGQRSALESIRTFACEISDSYDPPKPEAQVRGEYFRSGNTIRVRETYVDGRTTDFLSRNSEVLGLARDPNNRRPELVVQASRKSIRDPFCVCDAWKLLLFSYTGPMGAQLSLEELLLANPKRLNASKARDQGFEVIKIELVFDDPRGFELQLELFLDPKLNYLARKMVRTSRREQGTVTGVWLLSEFTEYGDGIYIPHKLKTERYANGKYTSAGYWDITNVRVNEPIPAEVFTLKIPGSIFFSDLITERSYWLDANGNPTGEGVRIVRGLEPDLRRGPALALGKQTSPDSGGYWLVIGLGLAILLLTAVGLAIFWKSRRLKHSL